MRTEVTAILLTGWDYRPVFVSYGSLNEGRCHAVTRDLRPDVMKPCHGCISNQSLAKGKRSRCRDHQLWADDHVSLFTGIEEALCQCIAAPVTHVLMVTDLITA